MAECPNCRASVELGDRFCGVCGHRLTFPSPPPDQQTHVPPPPPDYTPPPPPFLPPADVSILGNVLGAFAGLIAPRRGLVEVSQVAYEKLPAPRTAQSWKLVVLAVAMFGGFYLLEMGDQAFYLIDGYLMYFVATYAVAFLFLYWVYKSDRYEREPFRFVIFVFAWGVFSGILAAPLNALFAPVLQSMLGNGALIAPFVEEPFKALGLYYIAKHKVWGKEFNSPLDGVVYGFAAGLGFFAMENFHYFLNFDESVLVFRSLLCWGHGVWVATTGLWLAIAKVRRGRIVIWDLVPGLLVAMFLHFLWNGWSGFLGPEVGFSATIVQTIHQIWYSRKIIKEAQRDDVILGYTRGMAPVERY